MKMKVSSRAIDFDVAQALVNYVIRNKVPMDMSESANVTPYDIRCKLIDLKRDDGTVCSLTFNSWLSYTQDARMYGGVKERGISHLMNLVRKASFDYRPALDYQINKKKKQIKDLDRQIEARRHYTRQGRLRDMRFVKRQGLL